MSISINRECKRMEQTVSRLCLPYPIQGGGRTTTSCSGLRKPQPTWDRALLPHTSSSRRQPRGSTGSELSLHYTLSTQRKKFMFEDQTYINTGMKTFIFEDHYLASLLRPSPQADAIEWQKPQTAEVSNVTRKEGMGWRPDFTLLSLASSTPTANVR